MLECKETKQGVQFRVKVQPKASKNELAGIVEGELKVRLTAPPVEGEANQACIKYLSSLLGIARSNVSIVSGETSRHKLIEVKGLSLAQIKEKLAAD